MRKRHAFGCAGTPAGIKKFGDGHLVVRKNIGAIRAALVDDFFMGNPMPDVRACAAKTCYGVREIVLEDDHLRARMTQDRGQLQLGKADVQRHQNGARLDHAEVAFEQLVVVVAEIRHAIAGRDAELLQAGGQPLRALSELGRR